MSNKKAWEDLTIADDYMFKLVMGYKRICIKLLEIILNIKIRDIREAETEKEIKQRYLSKGVRLDVFVEDDLGTMYDIEMQVRKYPDEVLGRRTRYYQSMIDLSALNPSSRYDDLKKSIIIFICPFKLFNSNRHKYTFNNICQEDKSIVLDDGASKIFLSTKGEIDDVSKEVKNFLKFVDGISVKDDFVDEVKNLIDELKRTEKERANYMTFQMIMNEEREEGREEGRKEGMEKGMITALLSSVRNLMKNMGLSATEAMNALSVSADKQKELAPLI